jgi:hypothetical protein
MTFIQKRIQHRELPSFWRLSLLIAAGVLAFVAYSCWLPVENLTTRQRGAAFKAVMIHEFFGSYAKTVAPVAAVLAVACGISFAAKGGPARVVRPENRYD